MDQGCWFWTRGTGSGSGALAMDKGFWSWNRAVGRGPGLLVQASCVGSGPKVGVLFSTHIPAINDFSVKTDLAEYFIIWWWLSSLHWSALLESIIQFGEYDE